MFKSRERQNKDFDDITKKQYFLQPGYIFVSQEPYLIQTVLGSCVAVCLWDSKLKIGGMNHYIHSSPFDKNEKTCQYGCYATPHLVKLLLDIGSKKNDLRAHIIGGAQNPDMQSYLIGDGNIKVATTILKEQFIDILSSDTGGQIGRKVIFDNYSGDVMVNKVQNIRKSDWYEDN